MDPWSWGWMVIWIGALLAAVWLLVHTPGQRTTADEALSILRARFARGEISQAEYERARDTLSADGQESTR